MVRAWPRPTGPTVPELARLDTNMQSVMMANGVPGASLAIVKDGRLVLARGYGFAEVETNERYQPDSLWRTDSLAKTLTAATYMDLAERGKANLDTPILDLLQLEPPSYPGAAFDSRWTHVTARLALLHAGGWDRENSQDPLGASSFDPVFWPSQIAKDLGITRPVERLDLIRWMASANGPRTISSRLRSPTTPGVQKASREGNSRTRPSAGRMPIPMATVSPTCSSTPAAPIRERSRNFRSSVRAPTVTVIRAN